MNRFLYISALIVLFAGCKGFFGDKTDLEFIDKPVYQDREVAYVPIQPVMDQFVKPTQVLTGYDELIYVVDEGSSEIISFDVAGKELGRLRIPGLHKIAMDRSFDLLAIGTYDTSFNNIDLKLSCIYRINQKNGFSYGLQYASKKAVVIHPLHQSKSATTSDELVTYRGITTLGDNSYLVSRQGPNKPASSVFCDNASYDDAVLQIRPDLTTGKPDQFVSPILVTTSTGTNSCYWTHPEAITSLAQPPQAPDISSSRDFLFTSVDPDLSIKVQYIEYSETVDGAQFFLKELASGDTSKADGFLYEADKFSRPTGITIAGDRTNYIFVVDAEKDSLYQFNAEGFEGVNPPPFSTNKKQVTASFGGTGIGLNQFNNPTSVAYYQKIVYVADAGNGRVLRFKLTSDFD